jgi:hypothetical protein
MVMQTSLHFVGPDKQLSAAFSEMRKFTLWFAFLVAWSVAISVNAEDWKPAASPLMTRWGKTVTPENAWREYPRPQMVRTEWRSLNGLWDYTVSGQEGEWNNPNVENAVFDPLNHALPKIPSKWDGKILVPFAIESALSGVGRLVRPNQLLWYHCQFDVPKKWKEQNMLLHFDAVDWHTVVWVNGKKVGGNKGGYNSFSFNITDALNPDGPQQIALVVWDPTNAGDQAVGKQALPEIKKGFRYTPTTGIWQPVWLEPVPESSIQSLVITPNVDRASVNVAVKLATTTSRQRSRVKVTVFDGTTLVAEGQGNPAEDIGLNIPHAKLWSPESPFLYEVKVRMGTDSVTSYFGMRTIEVRADATGIPRIRLNGREVFSFGPLDQGYWPDGVLTPPSDEAAKADLRYLKDIGCNMVRPHVKVNPERWYYWADKLGLMVWQDFVCMPKYGSTIRASSAAQWQEEMAREITQLHNHPSIVEWLVFNEGWGQHDTARLTQWTMERDPSRLVCGASGWTDAGVGNTYDVHDYSFHPSIARPGQLSKRAMALGECGGFNVWMPGHLWGKYESKETVNVLAEEGRESYLDAKTWEQRYIPWLQSLQMLRSLGLCGAVYTQITDVEHECNGWLTYDRELSKISVEKLRQLHGQLYAPLPSLKPLLPLSAASAGAEAFKKHTVNTRAKLSFNLEQLPSAVLVRLDGAGSARLLLNGQAIKVMSNSDRANYVPASFALLSPDALRAFHVGENVLQVERSTKKNDSDSDQALDVGLFEITHAP